MTSAKLFMMGEERELLGTYMDYYKHTDAKGAPTSDLEGGFLKLSFVSQESDAIFCHHLTKALDDERERMEKGEIHFYSKGEDDLAIRKYKFRDAFIVAYSEEFNVDNTENMVTFLTISPAIQNYGFTHDFVKYWQVSWSPPAEPNYYQPKEEPEDRIIYINGHFYNKDGTFEGKVNEADFDGSVEDVYVCDGKGDKKDTFKNAKKLDIIHENFCYITGVIKEEDSSTFESAAATTQATFNAVKFEKGDNLSIEEQGKFAKKLLSINNDGQTRAYSTVHKDKKVILKDVENDSYCKNARKGLIHVLKAGKDFSEGAILWDGIDFADKGINHNKAKIDGGISITKDLWFKFVNNCEFKLDSKGTQRLYTHLEGKDGKGHDIDKTKIEVLATIPFKENRVTSTKRSYNIFDFVERKNGVWDIPVNPEGTKNVDYYETVGTGKYNKGRTLNKAAVVVGRHIFWKPYKEHPNNKGYYWKGMMNHKL